MADMAWYIPFLIFGARICDVSIGTVRTILIVEGSRFWSAFLGLIEVTIWVLAVGGVVKYLPNPFAVIGYAGGFATGVLIGMTIEDKIAIGHRLVRAINIRKDIGLCQRLRAAGYRATRVEGHGRDGPVEIAFLVVRRRKIDEVREAIHAAAPDAFVTVERVERLQGGGHEAGRFGRKSWLRAATVRK